MTNLNNFDEVYKEYGHLIGATINKKFNSKSFLELHGLTRDDLVQHGRLGMQKAIDTFDADKSSFRTHLINNIYFSISNECKKESLSRASGEWNFQAIDKVSFDSSTNNSEGEETSFYELIEDESTADMFEDMREKELFAVLEKNFPENTIKIFKMRMQGMTNKDIADALGISTHQSVSRTLRNAKERAKELIYNHS